MRFIFRSDASREVGSGHVMRSSVLAEEAISRGFECIFVGVISDLDWVSERIAKLGFAQVLEDEDLFQANDKSDVLILDTYHIPITNQFISRKNWKLVLSICDVFTPKYESDVELRPGLMKANTEQLVPIILSGPENILIRKGIAKSNKQQTFGEILKVLIVGGGSDPFGFVPAIAQVLGSFNMELEVHTFTNGETPEDSKVRFVTYPIGFDLDWAANMVDVVFTTASTSSLEFIAREIPTGVVCAADNQLDYYNQLGQLGCVSQIGMYNSNQVWDFNLALITELLNSQEKRESLKDATRGLIDLKGAKRVIDKLVSLTNNAED
jgi:UDP-2,4-diacetamido-2,4,6-trideoxy-beta-L-altropyranose hydrolase